MLQQKIKDTLDNKNSGRGEGQSETMAARQKLQEMRSETRRLLQQRNNIYAEINEADEARSNRVSASPVAARGSKRLCCAVRSPRLPAHGTGQGDEQAAWQPAIHQRAGHREGYSVSACAGCKTVLLC